MQHTIPFPSPTIIRLEGGPTTTPSATQIELEVFEAKGAGKGEPIVLCHGWPEHAHSWRHQIPALVEAGYHVIVPNQRGYGKSSRPTAVTAYDIEHLTGDLVGLLDHYGYADATFVGHDWGAMVVWGLALLHPRRVKRIINLSLPYQERGERPWIEMMEEFLGADDYFVHFNRQPGVADAVLAANTERFFRNLYRKNEPQLPPPAGMLMMHLAQTDTPLGEPLLSDGDLAVLVDAFEHSGFTASINWYRNLDRNWHWLAAVNPIIEHPALMIYGDRDRIPPFEKLPDFVPQVEVAHLDCGHWIQQEKPQETNRLMLDWLARHTSDAINE